MFPQTKVRRHAESRFFDVKMFNEARTVTESLNTANIGL